MNNDPLNLRDLPAPAPPDGLWPAIEAVLDEAPKRHGRRYLTMAVAASLALAFAVTAIELFDVPEHDAPAVAAANPELQRARAASARLEQELRNQRDGVLEASDIESLAWMEYELEWLDMQLAEQPADVELWRQRAGLLQTMTRTYQRNDWRAQVRLASF